MKVVYRNQSDVGRAGGGAVGRSVAKSCVANSSYSFEAILMKLTVNDDIEVYVCKTCFLCFSEKALPW